MATQNLPVSYDFFLKHTTHHDKYINFIFDFFETKYPNNEIKRNRNTTEGKVWALRKFYKNFYLKPALRRLCPIEFKAVPKSIKDIILQFPAVNTASNVSNNEQVEECQTNQLVENICHQESDDSDGAKESQQQKENAIRPSITEINGNDLLPFRSGCPISIKQFRLLTNIDEALKDKYFEKYGNVKFNEMLYRLVYHYWLIFYLKPEYRTEYPLNLVKVKENFLHLKKKVFTTKLKNVNKTNFNDDSKKESNNPENSFANEPKAEDGGHKVARQEISKDGSDKAVSVAKVTNACTNVNSQSRVQRLIQAEDVQDANMAEDDYEIAGQEILKDGSDEAASVAEVTNACKNVNSQSLVQRLIQAGEVQDVNMAEDDCEIASQSVSEEASDKAYSVQDVTNACKNSPRLVQCLSQAEEVSDAHMTADDCEHQQIPTTSNNLQLTLNLPVTYEEFKKHTYYKDVVEKIIKEKCKGNDVLYQKIKNSKKHKESALKTYYVNFYSRPEIRKKCPIRFKAMPKKIKDTIFQIPMADDCNNNANRQECLLNSDKDNDEPKTVNNDNAVNTENVLKENHKVTHGTMEFSNEKESQQQNAIRPSISEINGNDLLPFRSGCPISIKQFRLLTNIDEALKDKYFEKYGNVKFNEMLYRLVYHYWLIFYLKPEYRTEYPLNLVKVKENFLHLKKKVFTTKLKNVNKTNVNDDSKNENNNPENNPKAKADEQEAKSPSRQYDDYSHLPRTPPIKRGNNENSQPVCKRRKTISTEREEENLLDNNNSVENNPRESHEQASDTRHDNNKVVILENVLLHPPVLLNIPPQPITRPPSVTCSDKECIFNNISFDDFLQNTNILEISPQPLSNSELQIIYKKTLFNFMMKVPENSDDKLWLKNSFVFQMLRFKICDNCQINFAEMETEELKKLIDEADQSSNNSTDVNPSTSQKTSNILKTCNPDNNQNWVEKLKKEVLLKCSQPFDCSTFAHTFEQFKQCFKMPLKKILNDICNHDNEITKMLLKDKELCSKLLHYYYIKYHTKTNFHMKYPLKLNRSLKLIEEKQNSQTITDETNKQIPSTTTTEEPKNHTDSLKSTSLHLSTKELTNNRNDSLDILVDKEKSLQKSNTRRSQNIQTSSVTLTKLGQAKNQTKTDISMATLKSKQTSPISSISQNVAPVPTTSSKIGEDLEKAKRIIFRNNDKKHSLPYLLRTSFGLKQNIIRALFSMTYEEFHSLTYIYEGKLLYTDTNAMQCIYKRVFQTAQVWPLILYITLHDLCHFLKTKNIIISNYSTMLKYISPKFLHWSNLRICTNFDDSVCFDYKKRTGKLLNVNDKTLFNNECNDYYNRCWKYEKWIGQIPLVNKEFVKQLEKNQSDVTMFDMSLVQEISIQPKPVNDVAEIAQSKNNVPMVYIPSPSKAAQPNVGKEMPLESIKMNESAENVFENNTSSITPQQQPLNKLEARHEENSIIDHNYFVLPNTQQQIAMLPCEIIVPDDPLQHDLSRYIDNLDDSVEAVSFGELSDVIKKEPTEKKLLKNLNFYEDDNGEIHGSQCDEEIVILDDTNTQNEDNLPPSIIDFNDGHTPKEYLSGSGSVLPTSDNSDGSSLINLGQRLPSSAETNETQNSGQLEHPNYNDVNLTTNDKTNEIPKATEHNLTEVEEMLELLMGDDNSTDVNLILSQTEPDNDLVLAISDDSDNNTDDMSTIIDNQNVQHSNIIADKLKQIPSSIDFQHLNEATSMQQQQSFISSAPQNVTTTPTTFMEAQRFPSTFEASQKTIDIVQQNNAHFSKTTTTQNREIERNVTMRKKSKNITNLQVATIKPVQKSSEHVPQRQHHIRPLPGSSITQITTSCTVQILQQNQLTNVEQIATTTPTASLSNEGEQLQQPSPRKDIHVSQELTTNCTVFNNSSLLRIVDNNYQRKSPSSKAPSTETSPQTKRHSPRNVRKFLNYNQTNQAPVSMTQLPTTSSASTLEANLPVAKRTRRSSLNNDNNSKVNTLTNSNLIATISPTIHYPRKHIIQKIYLYRDLNKFHYFKELSPQHISTYLLPIVEFGKSYFEATITSENFKTRLFNTNNLAIFPYWSKSLQRDFFIVLNDVKEFHFNKFEYYSMQNVEDLRLRILFWLLYTASKFSHCHIITEANNTEFSHCETVQNFNNPSYKRLPFTNIKNSVKPSLLVKLKKLKTDLKSS